MYFVYHILKADYFLLYISKKDSISAACEHDSYHGLLMSFKIVIQSLSSQYAEKSTN